MKGRKTFNKVYPELPTENALYFRENINDDAILNKVAQALSKCVEADGQRVMSLSPPGEFRRSAPRKNQQ